MILTIKLNFAIMIKNMGKKDRAYRILFAIIIAVLYFSGVMSGTGLNLLLLLLAFVFAFTSWVNHCPLYVPFNISTEEKK